MHHGGDTPRFKFTKAFKAVDLGLRLADVEELGLDDEQGEKANDAQQDTLFKYGATEAEVDFLAGGRRVELNAFTSGDLVEFIEAKLDAIGVKKVIPPEPEIRATYERSARDEFILAKVVEFRTRLEEELAETPEMFRAPDDLYERVVGNLKTRRTSQWDHEVKVMAAASAKSEAKAERGREA